MSPDSPLGWRTAQISQRRAETPRATTLRLAVDGWPQHLAGQRVDIRLTAEDGYQASRAYSIASAPSAGVLELTVERLDDGEVSPYLVDEAQVGDELEVRGPIGGWFTWRPMHGAAPLVALAGGSGLVPLMAMAREAVAQRDPVPVRLLISTRTAADLLYADELGRLGARDEVRLLHTLTREVPAGWRGPTGRLSPELVAELLVDLPAPPDAVYVCGTSGFVDAASELLTRAGIAATAIRTERFGPSSSSTPGAPLAGRE